MPPKHKVERLEKLALKSVGEWVKIVGRGLCEPAYVVTQRDPYQGQVFLQHCVDYVRETLYASVPWYLNDEMAEIVLTAVQELVDETKASYKTEMSMAVFLSRMKVSVQLTEVVMHSHLKKLNVSAWPKIMRHVLNQNLNKLVGLQELNMGSGSAGWEVTDIQKYILSGLQWMSHLTNFYLTCDCTNTIISVITRHCPRLVKIDVTSSKSVTDRCIPGLLDCQELREIKIYNTSVTADGYKTLLMGLPKLENIGRCDELGKVLELLDKENSKSLPVLTLECRDMTYQQLEKLVKYCPNITGISLFHDEMIADIMVLSAFKLKYLKILNCEFSSDRVKDLLEKRGSELLLLHLEHVDQIDLNALIHISQCCPKLKTLEFYNCEFSQHNILHFDLKHLSVPPYACLESLELLSDCDQNHLEFLLKNCHKIKYIKLGYNTGIEDTTFLRVFEHNTLQELEELNILYSYELGKQTLDLLMLHCDKLIRLTELENWQGLSSQELREFREYIIHNNYKLNTKPLVR